MSLNWDQYWSMAYDKLWHWRNRSIHDGEERSRPCKSWPIIAKTHEYYSSIKLPPLCFLLTEMINKHINLDTNTTSVAFS